jgi:uncharacterized protein YwbE
MIIYVYVLYNYQLTMKMSSGVVRGLVLDSHNHPIVLIDLNCGTRRLSIDQEHVT